MGHIGGRQYAKESKTTKQATDSIAAANINKNVYAALHKLWQGKRFQRRAGIKKAEPLRHDSWRVVEEVPLLRYY